MVIANQPAAELEDFRAKSGIDFPFLVDEGAQVIARYGVANEAKEGLPHPAAFVLDAEGLVLFAQVDPNYKQRPGVEELLLAIEER